MAHPEQHFSVTGRGSCVAARLSPDSRVSASAAVFSLGVGIEEKIQQRRVDRCTFHTLVMPVLKVCQVS